MRATAFGAFTKFVSAMAAVLGFVLASPAMAEGPVANGSRTASSPTARLSAPVIIDGKLLFRLRGTTAFPAPVRATRVTQNIKEIARNTAIEPDSIKIVASKSERRIVVGDRSILTIVDADAEFEAVAIGMLAALKRKRIVQAIKEYRLERSPEVLRARAYRLAIALALAVLAITGFLFGSGRLLRVLDRRYKLRIKELKIQSFRLIRADQIYAVWNGAVRFVRTAVVVGLTFVTVIYALGLFPWTRPAARKLIEYLVSPLEFILAAILNNIPNLIFLAILFLLVRFVLRLIHMFFRAVDRGVIHLAQFESDWAILRSFRASCSRWRRHRSSPISSQAIQSCIVVRMKSVIGSEWAKP
ncbi:MAG: hypothetical protein P8Z76_20930 [Alphaproteobacteria bacterium]